jgi:HlyD family secretion protein
VTSVAVAKGDTVATGDVAVTVVGEGGATVTLRLDAAEVSKVKPGQAAEVMLPGATESVTGDVTWVSPVATSSGGTVPAFARTSTYAAHINVPAGKLAARILPQGAGAVVTVEVGASKGVLTVPTSAVIQQASQTVVQVLSEDGPESRPVDLGRIGPRHTEITSGIEVGDEVILADLDAEVDAAGEINTDTGAGFRGPGGGRPGGFRGPPGR